MNNGLLGLVKKIGSDLVQTGSETRYVVFFFVW